MEKWHESIYDHFHFFKMILQQNWPRYLLVKSIFAQHTQKRMEYLIRKRPISKDNESFPKSSLDTDSISSLTWKNGVSENTFFASPEMLKKTT